MPDVRVSQALIRCPLYFILDDSVQGSADPARTAQAALAAGIGVMQIRLKRQADRDIAELARNLRADCSTAGCLLIINDRPDLAAETGADGAHLGQHDMDVATAAAQYPGLIIGATARNPVSAMAAQQAGADYVGCGSVFASATKPGLPVIGPEGISGISAAVSIPVVAIGGIDASNTGTVVAAGAAGFCAVAPFAGDRPVGEVISELTAGIIGRGASGNGC